MNAMFDIFAQYATDPNLELEGAWQPIGAPTKMKEDGVTPDPDSAPQIKVARSGNKRHSRMLVQLYEANKTVLDMKDEAADARNDEITIELMAKSILLGWKNIAFKGEKLTDGYDYDTARKMLAVKDFREHVSRLAADRSPYMLEKSAKN